MRASQYGYRAMLRRLAAAIVILATIGILLIATWPQLFDLQRTLGVAQLVSLRAVTLVGALAIALVLLLLMVVARPFRRLGASLLVLAVAFAAVNGVVLASRGFSVTSPAPESRTAAGVTVLSWNTLGPATDPGDIATLAVEYEADVVVLPETREQDAIAAAVQMREAGRPMWVLTHAYDQISPARSTSLLVSVALGEYRFDKAARSSAVLPTVVATPLNGSGPTIVAVHAVAPMPSQMENWRNDLEWLADTCSGGNIIMAGDFNATIDHFSGLGSAGSVTVDAGDRLAAAAKLGECTDAAASARAGALGTWPTTLPAALGAPIDHVMATDDWKVAGFQVINDRDQNGSDHRPIVAWLEPAA